MKNNRWLIIIGLGIFIVICSIASFSIGVYVGEHGWTREGVEMSGPGAVNQPPIGQQVQQPAGQTNNQPLRPGLPPGRPQVLGRIQRISDDFIDLVTQEGFRQVTINETTRIETAEGDALEFCDLKKGMNVAVFGQFSGGDGKVLQAEVIVRLPENK